MEKAIRVKLTAMYEFPTLEEAEAFADFKKGEGEECPELRALDVEVIDKAKKQPA